MAHAASASSYRSDRMSPVALALAILLHGLVVAALFWLIENRPTPAPVEEIIEVSLEQPKPPEPPPPPPPKQAQQPKPPPPPEDMGLKPPAAITADKATQVPPAAAPDKKASAPQPPAPDDLPPLQAQPPQPPVADPPKPTPTPTPSPAARPPEQQALAAPPPPPARPPAGQHQDMRPSPLPPGQQRRAPAVPNPKEAPTTSHFVNPADAYNRARAADNYLWQVAMKLQGYRYQANTNASRGTTVVRVTIARNGRLLAVEVIRSSGVPEFDQGVLAGVRAGSPYSPLPPDIQGESASFNLPLISVNRN
ncbi:MAG: TonB family protein [Proteobacteria bacterium]|nr:TonB family protein [Pseudomonadota bacterium]